MAWVWVSIPAQRVLMVTEDELRQQFEPRSDGDTLLYVRNDNRVFRVAAVQPYEAEKLQLTYLTEV